MEHLVNRRALILKIKVVGIAEKQVLIPCYKHAAYKPVVSNGLVVDHLLRVLVVEDVGGDYVAHT